jgi:hypothetical protein
MLGAPHIDRYDFFVYAAAKVLWVYQSALYVVHDFYNAHMHAIALFLECLPQPDRSIIGDSMMGDEPTAFFGSLGSMSTT